MALTCTCARRSDLLTFATTDIAAFFRLTGGATGVMTTGVASEWSQLSSTYGYVFQITFTMFSVVNVTMAVISILTTIHGERAEHPRYTWLQTLRASFSIAILCLSVEVHSVALFVVGNRAAALLRCVYARAHTQVVTNLLRIIYVIVDPVSMWGTYSIQFVSFFGQGFICLTVRATSLSRVCELLMLIVRVCCNSFSRTGSRRCSGCACWPAKSAPASLWRKCGLRC